MRTLSLLGLVVLFALATSVAPTWAAPDYPGGPDLIVDDDLACSGATFQSIQAAVDAATPGTKIRVCPGDYYETILIGTPLKLVAKPLGSAVIHGSVTIAANQPAMQQLLGGHDVRLEGFEIDASGQSAGIVLLEADRVDIRNNTVSGASVAGINLFDSGETIVRENTVSYNTGHGIVLTGMVRSEVKHNIVNHNGGDGIRQLEGGNNHYDDNTADMNAANGISICYDAQDDLVEKNQANSNGQAGISICNDSVIRITVKKNVMLGNPIDAIDTSIGSGTLGTANTWSRNTCITSQPAGLCN
jgi:parallel beta-helix repeat protein